MVLICVLDQKQHLQAVVAVFVLSLFVMLYLLFWHSNPWQIFLIAILAEVLVALSFRVRKRPRRSAPKSAK